MNPSCTYHCRECGGHFTSLKAFDAHRPRNPSNGGCEWPEGAPLVELAGGVCRIGDPDLPAFPVTLYEHESASEARDYFQARNGAQALSSQLKPDAEVV